jgi:FMN phosphatase YigB (HAD superfamily)
MRVGLNIDADASKSRIRHLELTNTNALYIVTNHSRLAQLSVATKAGLQREFNAFVLVSPIGHLGD